MASAASAVPPGAGPKIVSTLSSNVTTESRSSADRNAAKRAAAALAASSGAPLMEPERSSTSATLIGARRTGVSPARLTSMPTWWAFWVVRKRVDRRTSVFIEPPGRVMDARKVGWGCDRGRDGRAGERASGRWRRAGGRRKVER